MQCNIMKSCEECAPGYVANDTGSTDCAQCSSGSVAPFMDGMKVDNDRLGQLRGLGRHEKSTTVDLASSEDGINVDPPSVQSSLFFIQILPVSATARRESGKIHLPALSTELTVLNREQTNKFLWLSMLKALSRIRTTVTVL